jgi:hypothetical protein
MKHYIASCKLQSANCKLKTEDSSPVTRLRSLLLFAFCIALLLLSGCILTPPDTTPPTVTLVAPSNNGYVSGAVTLKAVATDASGIKSVNFFVDDSSVGAGAASESLYSCSWDASGLADHTAHRIFARAIDSAGNAGYSETATVTVAATYDVDIYHGIVTVPYGEYVLIPFEADANDSLLGDARVNDSVPLSDFYWVDSIDFIKDTLGQQFTPHDRQSNQSQLSVADIMPAAGQYYLLFGDTDAQHRNCTVWVRFVLRKWK